MQTKETLLTQIERFNIDAHEDEVSANALCTIAEVLIDIRDILHEKFKPINIGNSKLHGKFTPKELDILKKNKGGKIMYD